MIDELKKDQSLKPRWRRSEEAIPVGIDIEVSNVQGELWSDVLWIVPGKVDACSMSDG